MNRVASQHRRGFTIAEVSVCVVIVGMMLAAVMQTVGQASVLQYRVVQRARANQLARMLMAEVVQQAYAETGIAGTTTLGPESGETRATYEDVDDYNGLSESPPVNKDGSTMNVPSASSWRRTVSVQWLNPTTLALASPQSESGAKLITVNVYYKTILVTKLTAIRTNAP
jgi:MSHA pilin protein MshD